ncbi:uncharacterized protein LOC122268096 [Penaeus japonicus]|uniref:uncharacterized protein LOC122268096 n=1 Tax=Penaeus japonicus TaxID=27405 RepID=UPI001C70CAD2|nr:uncharacterized protein LOC122268096 [Penaeus japonicus]
MYVRGHSLRSLARILVQNEKLLLLWLFVVLFLHICQHSFHYEFRQSPSAMPPRDTESQCQKGCFKRRMESPLMWNHASLVDHVKELIHQGGQGGHAHKPSNPRPSHATKSSNASYVIPKDDSLAELQKLVGQILGSHKVGNGVA